MFRNRDTIFRIAAATAVIAALSAVPALADETAAAPTESTPVAVTANDTQAPAPAVDSAAMASMPKPKTVRTVAAPTVRPPAVSYYNTGCSGFWCRRQFVLMLGVGY
jgi:hypothetical protein